MKTFLHETVEQALNKHGIEYRTLECDPDLADTAAFCEAYGYTPNQSANTILVAGKGHPLKFACCVVLADTRLDVNKKVCQLLGVKKASFASAEQTMEISGMMIGGVTAIGLPDDIPLYIDAAVIRQPEVIMGGGNRSSKVVLKSAELQKLPHAQIIEDLAKSKEPAE